MKLLELNKATYEVEISPEAAILKVFNKVIKKDRSIGKETAKKELGFIWHYTDVKSDFSGESDPEKTNRIIEFLGLSKNWKITSEIQDAIDYCLSRRTINETLYESAKIAAIDISNYLRGTKDLLEERSVHGGVVTDIAKITSTLDKIPNIMAKLNEASIELIKEQKNLENRKKGTKEMNMFEDGI